MGSVRLGLLAALAWLLASCAPPGHKDVSVHDLARSLETAPVIVDVREPWEYAEGHVPGAILIPLGQLAARVDELPGEEPIYVICRSGNRSVTASTLLIEAGKRDVRNVAGGMLAWQAAGYAVDR